MKKIIASVVLAGMASGALAAGSNDIGVLAKRLAETQDFAAKVDYKVLLPLADEPINYTIVVASSDNDEDSLAAADYVLEWTMDKDGSSSHGFTSYFGGNLYRYRDQLLREYHLATDPEVFAPVGDASKGMQNHVQFGNLLPQYMAMTLREMASDSTYKFTVHADTVVDRQRAVVLDGVRSYCGEVAQQFVYVFDRDMMPVGIELINNPGKSGEQVVTATYDYSGDPIEAVRSEEDLANRYPEAFAKYRESTLALGNLKGRRLPSFSSPTPSGERYTFDKNSRFARQTIIAVLDAEAEGTQEYVANLRKNIAVMDERPDLILAFVNNNAERIEAVAGELQKGEHILMSVRGLARDCGVGKMPAIIECDSEGTVVGVSEP